MIPTGLRLTRMVTRSNPLRLSAVTVLAPLVVLSSSAASATVTHQSDVAPEQSSALASWISGLSDGLLSPLNLVAVLAALAIAHVCRQAWASRVRIEHVWETPTTAPPSGLHPAYAGALASGRVSDAQIEATVLELAQKGAIVIEPDPETGKRAQVRILDSSRAEHRFESRLLRQFEERSSAGVIDYWSLKRLRRRWGEVGREIRRDLEEFGWLNPKAGHLRLPFYVTGLIGLVLAASLSAASIIAAEPWPVAGAGIAGLTGVAAFILAGILPVTTRTGEFQALPWRGYRTGLTEARDSQYGSINLDQAFPYIVAMSMSFKFERHLRRASDAGYVPRWLGARDHTGNWYASWMAFHSAIAPTDASNTAIGGSLLSGSGIARRPL